MKKQATYKHLQPNGFAKHVLWLLISCLTDCLCNLGSKYNGCICPGFINSKSGKQSYPQSFFKQFALVGTSFKFYIWLLSAITRLYEIFFKGIPLIPPINDNVTEGLRITLLTEFAIYET
jgi:hypothetical protein